MEAKKHFQKVWERNRNLKKKTPYLPAFHHTADVPYTTHEVKRAQLEGICEQGACAWGAKFIETAGKHMHMNANVFN
jgi:hypothetical protein